MYLLRVLLDPVDGLPPAIRTARWVVPLLLLMAATSASAAAYAVRWDAGPTVVRQLEAGGELASLTEREVAEKVTTAARLKLVGGVAQGLFLTPLLVLLLATLLKFCGWLLAVPAPFVRCLTAAALALLPQTLYHLIFAAAALRQSGLRETDVAALVPSQVALLFPTVHGAAQRALAALEFFNLWSVVLLGLGFAAASGLRRRWALLLSFTLYAMYTGVWTVGLAGLTGRGSP